MCDFVFFFQKRIENDKVKKNKNDEELNLKDLNNVIIISDTNTDNKNIVNIDNESSFMKAYSKFAIDDKLNIVLYCEVQMFLLLMLLLIYY